MTILLVAEHDNKTLNPLNLKALSAAVAIGGDIHVLVAGEGCRAVAEAAAKMAGVTKVKLAESPQLAQQLAEEMAALIVPMMAQYDVLIAPAASASKSYMPRAAALLDVAQISEITAVHGPHTFERPIYAGNALQTVQSKDTKKVITVRTASFPAAAAGEGGSAAIEAVSAPAAMGISSFERNELSKSERPELTSAKIVISGGRGMQAADNFKTYIEPVADRLRAAVGASRAAVDAGYAPNETQVGQTGKVVAPDLSLIHI